MVPQSPPPSCYPYPSPQSRSPPSVTQLKASRKLPILKYPLTDITNFTLAQTTLELSNLAPNLTGGERPVSRARDIFNDPPSKKGRGKTRRGRGRGRSRVVRTREVGGSMSGGAVLRAPIPSPRFPFYPAFDFRVARPKSTPFSPTLSIAHSHQSTHKTINAQSRTPRRRFPAVSAVTPEAPRHACKRTKRWPSTSPRDSLVSLSSPPSPTPIARRLPRSHKHLPNTPSGPPQPPPLLRFPIPPPSTPAHTRSSPSNVGQQLSLLPAMNLGSGTTLGQVRKKRTKRDLAEVQWQITMHKSLAWRTTREHLNSPKQNMCEQCTSTEEDPSHGVMDFVQGGLKIAFEQLACTCATGNEPKTINNAVQSHWTDSLDRELVKRLWVKLIAQGCRTIPIGISRRPQEVTVPFPTMEHSRPGIPFPSSQHAPLAPAIQLSSISCPGSNPQMSPGISPRRRVSAILSSSKARPHVSLPNMHISSSQLCTTTTVSMLPPSSFTADPMHTGSQCQKPRVSVPIPKGTLTSAQLAAQAILRHGEARSKPMRRGRPPGIMQRESSLRHEVTTEHDD